MKVRLLGPVGLVGSDGATIGLGGHKERALLAVLAIHAGQVLSEGRLIDALWGDDPPRTAARTLQSYLSRLRKVLAEASDDRDIELESHPGGWTLRVARGAIDITAVETQVSSGRMAADRGDHIGAALAFADALRAWQGRPLEEFADRAWAVLEAARLDEFHQAILERRVDAELACGRHTELTGELEATCRSHPLRERPWAQWMLALYRSGRQAEALRVYQELRSILAEELGIEPSPTLARLENQILTQDPGLEWRPTAPGRPADERAEGRTEERTPTAVDGSGEAIEAGLAVPLGGVVSILSARLAAPDVTSDPVDDQAAGLRRTLLAAGARSIELSRREITAVFAGAVDGVAAAVALQQAIARSNRHSSESDRGGARVGVHAADAARTDHDSVGEAREVARRLCGAAAAGEIVVSRLIADLVGSRGGHQFTTTDNGGVVGGATTMATCTVAWSEPSPPPLPEALAALTKVTFVGREAELSGLQSAWRLAQAGHREVVFLAGEPGIGKTALAVHMAEMAWKQGAVVLFGRCDEESLVAFQPFLEAIAQFVETMRPEELRRLLGPRASDLALLIPALGRRLPELADVVGTGAETERYRIFEAVAGLLAAIGADSPVVAVIDDLHWADRPTLGLLQHLIRHSTGVPLLILGTYRDTDLVRTHPMAEALADMRRADLVTRIAIHGLSPDEVVDLVCAGQLPQPADKAFARALWDETEGSPLFLREILRHLTETGGIAVDQDGKSVPRRRIDQLGIPEGVKEVIGRRLSRLPEVANTALRTGAVAGREFRLDVLEVVTGLGTDELLDALEVAVGAGVIDEATQAVGRWEFTHALVRQTLYDELSLTRRVRLHQRVGEALESLDSGATVPLAELAYHFSQAAVAGSAGKAISYARQAGEQALLAAAYEQAVQQFGLAVEVAEDAGVDIDLRADLLLARGRAEMRVGDHRVARATFERVVDLVGGASPERMAEAALGYTGSGIRPIWIEMFVVNEHTVGLLEAALGALPEGDTDLRARLLASLAQELYFLAGTETRRQELSSAAVAMARRLGSPATLAYVLAASNLALWGPDTASEFDSNANELLQLAEALDDRELLAYALRFQIIGFGHIDDMPAQFATVNRFEALVEELRDPVAKGVLRWVQGWLKAARGEFEAAVELAIDGYHLGQESGDRNAIGATATVIAFARLHQGRLAEVVNAMVAAVDVYPAARGWANAMLAGMYSELGLTAEARTYLDLVDPTDPIALPRNIVWPMALSMLARASHLLGDATKADTIYGQLAPTAHLSGFAATLGMGSVRAPLGIVAGTAGRFDEAAQHFEAAMVDNARLEWRPWVADTQYYYADLLARRDQAGDRGRAIELLDDAIATATELEMTALAHRSARLRDELVGPAAPTSASAGPGRRGAVSRRDRARAKLSVGGRAVAARWTRQYSDDELSRRFGSNLAQRAVFGAMSRSFQPNMAFGFSGDLVFELRPRDDDIDPVAADWWTIEVRGRKATARRGRSDVAAVVVQSGLADFIRLSSGEVHPIRALIENRVRVEGDVILAARLPDLFGAVEPLGLAVPDA